MNYYDRPELSYSKFKSFINDPREYEAIYLSKTRVQEESEAMKFGNKFHCFLLEDYLVDTNYAYEHEILDEFMTTSFAQDVKDRIKKGKITEAKLSTPEFKYWFENIKAGNKEIIRDKEILLLTKMQQSVDERMKQKLGFTIKEIQKLELANVKVEQESFFKDSYSGIDCKTKMDFLIEPCAEFRTGLIVELKTIDRLISKSHLRKHIEQMYYHIQLYFNIVGFQALYGLAPHELPRFFWCVVEKKEDRNYCVIVEAQLSTEPSYFEVAKSHFATYVERLSLAMKTGNWTTLDFDDPAILTPSNYLIDFKNNPDLLFNENDYIF